VAKHGRLDFWQIAVKPGRPLAFGRIGQAVFIGLPGNPVAAMICFLRFARPVLRVLAGGTWPTPRLFKVKAGFAMSKKPGRREYLRARLVPDGAGDEADLVAIRIEREGSGILTSLTEADGLIELAEGVTEIRAGDLVPFVPFSEFGLQD
jgi:molybdopterin molybdotransferase